MKVSKPQNQNITKHAETIQKWLENIQVSYTTKRNYNAQINKFYANYDTLTDITIEKYLLEGSGDKRSYIRKFAFKSYLQYLGLYEQFKDCFAKVEYRIKDRKQLNTLKYSQVTRLINEISDERLKVILMILFDAGCRVRAVLKITKKDIIQDGNKYFLWLRDKGDESYQRPITPETHQKLADFFEKSDKNYPFLGINGVENEPELINSTLDDQYFVLYRLLKSESQRILNEKVSFHWIRRCSGVYWYKKTGNSLRAIQEWLHHKSPDTTSKYLKIEAEVINDMYDKERREW